MTRFNVDCLQFSPRAAIALAASSALFLSGCSNLATTATSISSQGASATVTGKIHGGNQPVSGATVTINFAGFSGLPSASTLVATTTSANDGAGSFAFIKDPVNGNNHPTSGNTFSCPSSGNPFAYLVARGGNTLNDGTSSNNSAAVFVAPLGLCSTLSGASFTDLSEVTTVATMAAMAQYFDPVTESFGADSITPAQTALQNAATMVSNLVDLTHGTSIASKTTTGSNANLSVGVSALSLTLTPEQAKINTLANIISACVNNASSSATACSTLFANATPPNATAAGRRGTTFPAATDVLQALYYIFSNPTNGGTSSLQTLYALAPATAPYQPSLSVAPNDWTVAIKYNSSNTCGATPDAFINSPTDLDVNQYGIVWFSNGASGNLSAIAATGIPYACITVNGGARAGGVVDSVGNVWSAGNASGIYRYPLGSTAPPTAFATVGPVLAIAADGSNNIFFTTAGSLYEIPNGANIATPGTTAPIQISSVVGSPARLAIDSNGAIWSASGNAFISRTIASASNSDPAYLNGFSTTTFTTAAGAYGIDVTSASGTPSVNSVFVTTGTASQMTVFAGSGTAYSVFTHWPTASNFAGMNNPTAVVLDGAANAWTPNNTLSTSPVGGSISEISEAAAALSPNGFIKDTTYLGAGRAAVVDQSGNVWVASDGSNGITEILSAAVPRYQPESLALNQHRFQSKP